MRFDVRLADEHPTVRRDRLGLDLSSEARTLESVVSLSSGEWPWLPSGDRSRAQTIAERCIVDIFGESDNSLESDDVSIYETLRDCLSRCDPDADDLAAISPGPVVNDTLNRLVDIIRGGSVGTVADRLAMAVDRLVVQRIRASEELQRRSRLVRYAAGLAEAALEYHYSARLTRRLRRVRAGYRTRGLDAILGTLDGFPYLDSYLELVKAEVSILPDRPSSMTVGGCGPLPVTGLLYHVFTGASIELVDVHPNAVAAAQDLISEMERLGVLQGGAIRVRCEDIGALLLDSAYASEVIMVASLVDESAKLHLSERIAAMDTRAFSLGRVSSINRRPPPVLLLRSAKGLCAELAYEPISRTRMEATGLVYSGELVPCNHVVSDISGGVLPSWDLTSLQSSTILDVLPAAVLNSTERYRHPKVGA